MSSSISALRLVPGLGVQPRRRTGDARGVYVCDGSTFPTASGVNPMVTIEALAHLNASRLAGVLARA